MIRTLRRAYLRTFKSSLRWPPYRENVAKQVAQSSDPVRYSTIALAIHRIRVENIPGAVAECGVWRGELSRFLQLQLPERKLYLFDTFSGFPDALERNDHRFQDTSIQAVAAKIGNLNNVIFRKGTFPDSANGIEERFAFVMLDFDIYIPTKAGLEFFYPRTSKGGYVFLHDYNSTESNAAVKRAADEFLKDKPEQIIDVADTWGSVLFRKLTS